MKLKYIFVCILAAASLTVSPEIVLAHEGGGHGGGGVGHGSGGFSETRGSFSGRGDHGRFGDRGRDRDFRGRRFRNFDGDLFDFGFYGFGHPDYYQYNYPYYYSYPYYSLRYIL